METNARGRPLAGLVSDEAERLYARLLETGSIRIGTGAGEVDPESAPARELVELRIAYRSRFGEDSLWPVARSSALRILLSHHHTDIAARQNRAISAWELLDSILTTSIESGKPQEGLEFVEFVAGRDRILKLSFELNQAPRYELLGLATGRFGGGAVTERELITPTDALIQRGGRFRMIYDTEYASSKAGAHMIEASVAAGEEARIRPHLPLKMLFVDDNIALVALTATAIDGSLLVRSPVLLAALREWFELLWNDNATTAVGQAPETSLSATQRQVLRLLATGQSDDAIARAADMSVRTVRRHVAAILEMLGVSSRFAAGAMAAKRGWI